jgi:hypothetical protein
VRAPEYLSSLVGTIGADPIHRPLRGSRDTGQDLTAEARRLSRVGDAVGEVAS